MEKSWNCVFEFLWEPWIWLQLQAIVQIGTLLSVKSLLFSNSSILACVLGAQKNPLNETVLLSTHNTCFDGDLRKK